MDRRTLRHNLDAEASVLGGVILRNDLLVQLDTLEVEDFYHFPHKVVFEAMRNLEAAERPIDVVLLENEIERQDKLDAIGGIAFLGELAMRVPTVDNVISYAEIVKQLSLARRLTLFAGDLVERCLDADVEPEDVIDHALAVLNRIDSKRPDELRSIGELARGRIKQLDEILSKRSQGEVAMTGAPTGIAKLDAKIGGWQFGVVNEIAARPAMGKTSFGIATADASSKTGHGVHVFSLEDSAQAYVDKCLSRRSGVAGELIRGAQLGGRREGQTDYGRVLAGAGELVQRPNWKLDDRKGLTASEIIRAVRKHKRANGTRVVIVDYVQLVRGNPHQEQHERLDEIMTAFAAAAEPDEAWVVMSQLNRKLEDRADRRPQMTDLRGSGALEERAKVIVGLYRGSVYGGKPKCHIDYECNCDENVQHCVHAPSLEQWERQALAVVIKNNGGANGAVLANWNAPTMEIW